MKAIVINDFGGPEQLQLVERPMPPITDDQVLVAVRVAAVNPIDWRIRKGQMKQFVPYEFPAIMGREVSGVAAKVGAAVRGFAVGDAVFGFLQQRLLHWGGYADYVPVEAAKLAHKPEGLSFEQAAALPVAGHTAWQGLFEVAQLKPGEVVLITGAAGGVGSLAVQLACDAGATVIASAGPANHAFVRSLGASLVVDYRAPDFAATVAAQFPAGVDVIFATFAGMSLQGCAPLVRTGTRIVLLSPEATDKDMHIGPVTSQILIARADGAQLEKIAQLAVQGRLRPQIGAVLPLEQAARAHDMSESHHTRGKILLRVAPDDAA
jgi:NADPH:quinone reductase-like Zn-dependent oxidoreductase